MEMNKAAFTPRETEVIVQLLTGKSNKQIALELGITNRAVEFHLSSIYTKLGVGSRSEAIIKLKDAPLREPVSGNPHLELRQSAVEIETSPQQNGDHPIPAWRSLMTNKILVGIFLGFGSVLIAALLIRSASENRQAPTADPIALITTEIPTVEAMTPRPNITPSSHVDPTQMPSPVTDGGHARFISETIPDGTSIDPGQSITKTWTILNDGMTSWNADYALLLTQGSHPLGQTLGEPARIPLPRLVQPGEQVEISIPLTAPKADAIFSAVYQLQDPAGGQVEGDGNTIWFSVVVGSPQVTAQNGEVSMQLKSIQKDTNHTSARICAQYPDTQDWNPYPVTLQAAGVTTGIESYQLEGVKDPGTGISSYRCFFLGFPVGTDQYGSAPVLITIGSIAVDASTHLEANCARAKKLLSVTHPGLDFTCGTPGFFYSGVQASAGLAMDEAERLVMDALEQRITGPWVFEG
jgi:DNA-binding CsgD family transcriptional regulator